MTKLHFKTTAAANLFASEITGQLSDGAWENTRPLDHWKFWCDAEVVVDGKVGHEGNPMKTNYNLGSLKKYVKDGLLNAIRITKTPWFDMSWSDFTRTLTDECYLKFMPSCLERRSLMNTPDYIREHYQYTVKDRYEKAIRAIGDYCTDEFKQMIEDEIVKQMITAEEKYNEAANKRTDEAWQKLAQIGVTDEDSLHEMINKIREVKVSDHELDAALDEIKSMMTTKI